MNLKLLWMLCALMFCLADGYHILCIFGIPTRSHHQLGSGIVNALLKGGHEVTWVTPYPPKNPEKGLHIIDASITIPITAAIDMTKKRNSEAGVSFIRRLSANVTTTVSSIPALRDALVNGRFDAVFTEKFFSDIDAGYAAVLQIPWIMLSGVVMQPSTETLVDEVRSIPVLPLLFNDFGLPMTLYERIKNVGLYNLISFDNWWHEAEEDQRYNSMFSDLAAARGFSLPPLAVAVRNLSILFVSSHPTLAPAQSLPPNVVNIGGYHIDENVPKLPEVSKMLFPGPNKKISNTLLKMKRSDLRLMVGIITGHCDLNYHLLKTGVTDSALCRGCLQEEETINKILWIILNRQLYRLFGIATSTQGERQEPQDLQEIMDSSPQGVVYFSMGSVLRSSALPSSTKQGLVRVLGKLPYTVLWKFEEELEDLPKNVHIRPWMPQTSILAHNNTRVFVTHGGLLSNLEAVKFGVPLVAIPVFGDQPSNAARAERAGYAVKVTYDTSTMPDGLEAALRTIMQTDEYQTRVKYLSLLFNKRLVPPSKQITHYVELAIESKGADHLRSKALLYQWYQLWMLDILTVLLLTLYMTYRILKTVVKYIARVVGGSDKNKVKKN